MSLDFYLEVMKPVEVFSANITHNLVKMADEAGIYEALWHPERIGATEASHIISILEDGLAQMKADPPRFQKHNPSNGWGSYADFVPWIERVLTACKENPGARIRVWV